MFWQEDFLTNLLLSLRKHLEILNVETCAPKTNYHFFLITPNLWTFPLSWLTLQLWSIQLTRLFQVILLTWRQRLDLPYLRTFVLLKDIVLLSDDFLLLMTFVWFWLGDCYSNTRCTPIELMHSLVISFFTIWGMFEFRLPSGACFMAWNEGSSVLAVVQWIYKYK